VPEFLASDLLFCGVSNGYGMGDAELFVMLKLAVAATSAATAVTV
jgi:hypothetical protein